MADEKNRADGDSSSLEKEKFETTVYGLGDMSAEKRAEALAEWVDGALAILDQKGNELEFNEPMAAWLDQPNAPLAGRSFWELLAARCPDWVGAVKELRRGQETFAQVPPARVPQPAPTPRLTLVRVPPAPAVDPLVIFSPHADRHSR